MATACRQCQLFQFFCLAVAVEGIDPRSIHNPPNCRSPGLILIVGRNSPAVNIALGGLPIAFRTKGWRRIPLRKNVSQCWVTLFQRVGHRTLEL